MKSIRPLLSIFVIGMLGISCSMNESCEGGVYSPESRRIAISETPADMARFELVSVDSHVRRVYGAIRFGNRVSKKGAYLVDSGIESGIWYDSHLEGDLTVEEDFMWMGNDYIGRQDAPLESTEEICVDFAGVYRRR